MKLEGIRELLSVTVLSWFTSFTTDEFIQAVTFGVSLIVAFTTIILNITRAVKHAKSDGKVTMEEFEVIASELKEGLNQVNNIINKDTEDAK